jgi:hypothetical protein
MFTLRQGGRPDRELPAGVYWIHGSNARPWLLVGWPGDVKIIASTEYLAD